MQIRKEDESIATVSFQLGHTKKILNFSSKLQQTQTPQKIQNFQIFVQEYYNSQNNN